MAEGSGVTAEIADCSVISLHSPLVWWAQELPLEPRVWGLLGLASELGTKEEGIRLLGTSCVYVSGGFDPGQPRAWPCVLWTVHVNSWIMTVMFLAPTLESLPFCSGSQCSSAWLYLANHCSVFFFCLIWRWLSQFCGIKGTGKQCVGGED